MINPSRRRLSQCQFADEAKETSHKQQSPKIRRTHSVKRSAKESRDLPLEIPWPAKPLHPKVRSGPPAAPSRPRKPSRGRRSFVVLETPAELYQLQQFLSSATSGSSNSDAENKQLVELEYSSEKAPGH